MPITKKNTMCILIMMFILNIASASLDTIVYSKKTGHITLIGQYHPRVLVTNDNEDTFLICGLNIEEAGCIELHYNNEFHNDIESFYTTLPPANIPYACYSKLRQSHLLPLCSMGNLTIKHDGKERKLKMTIFNVKPLSDLDIYASRFWISLVILMFSTIAVLVWSGDRS